MPETGTAWGEVVVTTIGVKRDYADDPPNAASRATPPPPDAPRAPRDDD